MSVAGNQRQIFLRLAAVLRPHWRSDAALPARIQTLLAGDRRFGSRDRRLYRELIYTTLRYLPWIEPLLDSDPDEAVRQLAWLATESPATRVFRLTFAVGDAPAGDRAQLLPAWFKAHCPELFAPLEIDTQLLRAPLWLRLQTTEPQRVRSEFDAKGWTWRPSPLLPSAMELLSEVDLTQTQSWQEGRVEIQDLGSQLLLSTLDIPPGGAWLDACAGAGGKALQLAALLGSGKIDAYDIRPEALRELQVRALRAGLLTSGPGSSGPSRQPAVPRTRATLSILRQAPDTALYDGVLVDAPCSGSGTWRRAPHLKWVTTEATIARHVAIQRTILEACSARVRAGGLLVYATCSLSSAENEGVVNAFLLEHGEFQPEPFARTFDALPRNPGLLFLPSLHNTDGFYVAALRRTA
jgi:16S rRNA (cytosine967-C5)-methyltransferase